MRKTCLSNKRNVSVAASVLDANQPHQVIPLQSVHPVLIFMLLVKSARLDCTDYIKATNEL